MNTRSGNRKPIKKAQSMACFAGAVFMLIWFGVIQVMPSLGATRQPVAPAQNKPQENKETAKPDSPSVAPAASQAESLTMKKSFHIAGVPKMKRHARGDLVFTQSELLFKKGKTTFRVQFERLRKVQLFSSDRHYENATAAVAMASPVAGMLMMFKKHKVDILVLDYVGETGALMGMVFQVEQRGGGKCKEWLARFGINAEEPPQIPNTPVKQ